jgi:5S rRNA maturation endonuclease (ribonuclease M5)
VPLARSDNERARALVNLDEKFLTDPAEMNPQAASYFRRRPFLSSEACRKWRVGYLPRSTGADRSGGTMRGTIVYPLLSERGEVLTWFGRDPQFEQKQQQWITHNREGREPEKFHFVKGFQRGLELFGQQASRLTEPGYREAIREIGILVVEGPNDVIALDTLGVPAVGLCSNTISQAQVEKLARWARQLSDGSVTLFLDYDEAGQNGAKQALVELAPHCRVRLAWSPATHPQFKGRQPESLTAEEWQALRSAW